LPRLEKLEFLTPLLESGELTPVLDRTYALSATAEAVTYLAEGHARGKVVITV
jgi:NADPH:quinone reductase-like Zn-dependent oxidoreductase